MDLMLLAAGVLLFLHPLSRGSREVCVWIGTRVHMCVHILQDSEMINVCRSKPSGLHSSRRKLVQDPSPPLQ